MNLLPACPSDPPATILFLAGRFLCFNRVGNKPHGLMKPVLTWHSCRRRLQQLQFWPFHTLPHLMPPHHKAPGLALKGIGPSWPLECRVTASGALPTAATLAVFGFWQCIITTSFESSCSTGWVGILAAANVLRDVPGLRAERVWPSLLPCFFTGKWNANSRHQLPPGIYHFYKPPQKHRDALSHTVLTAMYPPF